MSAKGRASNIAVIFLLLAGLVSCGAKPAGQGNQFAEGYGTGGLPCQEITYHILRGAYCLGPICLDRDIWADAEPFFYTHGKGFAREDKFPAYWYVTKDGIHVNISRYHGENKPIESIVVSKYPYYTEKFGLPEQPFGDLDTECGIRLGDSYEKVIDTYGPPHRIWRERKRVENYIPDQWKKLNDGTLFYIQYFSSPSCMPWSEIYFLQGKVIAIIVSTAS